MDVLHVVVAAPVHVEEVATQVVALVDDRQKFVGLVERLVFRNEVRQHYQIYDFDFRSIHPNHFLDIVATSRSHLRDGLDPEGKDNVCLGLDFEEALGVLAVPEKIIKYLISVVEGRPNTHFSYVIVWVEPIEKLLTFTDILSKIA